MKAFVIRLSKVPSSLESSERVMRDLRDFQLDVEPWEGTYGHEAPEIFESEGRELFPLNIKSLPVEPRDIALCHRPGVMGCFHSHYRLWEHCLLLNQPILIFEDDVIFTRGWTPVEWEDVLLVATGKSVYKHSFYQQRLYHPIGEPKAGRFKGKVMPGAVGYGITVEGAKKLVNTFEKYFMPADNCMNHTTVKLQCHTYLMGRADVKEHGKKSLTKSRAWTRLITGASNSLPG